MNQPQFCIPAVTSFSREQKHIFANMIKICIRILGYSKLEFMCLFLLFLHLNAFPWSALPLPCLSLLFVAHLHYNKERRHTTNIKNFTSPQELHQFSLVFPIIYKTLYQCLSWRDGCVVCARRTAGRGRRRHQHLSLLTSTSIHEVVNSSKVKGFAYYSHFTCRQVKMLMSSSVRVAGVSVSLTY